MTRTALVKSLFGVMLLAATSGCRKPAPPPSPVKITVAGSTAVVPLLKDAATRYSKQNPHVTIDVSAGGSHVGLQKVAAGAVTLGASDVAAEGTLAAGLVDHSIAVVGFAVMANKGMFNEAIRSLTKEEVAGVFTGKYKNWVEIGGDDEPIVVVNRTKQSGSRAAFGALVLGGEPFVVGEEQDSSSKVQELLLRTSGAVSYLALSYRNPALKVFAYEKVEPTEENIKAGGYPLWTYEHLYTKGEATEPVVAFISFLTSGRYSREVLPGLGFIPLNDMRIVRDRN